MPDSLDDLVAAASKRPSHRQESWVEKLDPKALEFAVKMRKIKDSGKYANPVETARILREHFNVEVSDQLVRQYLNGKYDSYLPKRCR